MSLNLIDISSHQEGINLETVFSFNPLDGIIVKSTEGQGYVNPSCDKWVQWCIRNGKPWGFYHYLNSHDPVAEAKYFVKHCMNYFHDGLPAADYEGSIVATYGTNYLRRWLETVYAETGVRPLVYCNLSTIQADVNGFRSIAEDGYPLWLAQWIGNITGFQPNPPQKGSYEPFKKLWVHQYTDRGNLNQFSGALDLDIFYGTEEDWHQLAGKTPQPAPQPTPEPAEDWLLDWIEYLETEKTRIQTKIDELKGRRSK